MPGLKLTMATSIYGNPYKWVRTLATTTTSYNPLSSSSPSSFYALNNTTTNPNTQKISVSWRITPCAPLAHVRINPRKNLGFRSHKSFSSSSSSSYTQKSCSEDSGGERDSSSSSTLLSGGAVGEKMGSEDNHYNRQLPSLPSQQQQQQQSQLQQQLQHPQSSKLLTLPTILTLGRVAAVPLLVSTFYLNSWWGTTATTSIFIAAAITDWLDGYIARKMRLGTAFGAFLDPVADKLMVAATLILLCSRPFNVDMFGEVPWLLTVPAIAIIGREITMSAVREWAASQNAKLLEAVAVNNLGKWKTASQMTALTILLATRDSSLAGPGVLVASGVGLLYISAGLAIWSLVVYMMKIWKVLLK